MNLSAKDFLLFVFHEKGAYGNEKEIYKLVCEASIKKMRVAAPIVIFVGILMLIRSFARSEAYGEYLLRYRCMYLLLIALMLVVLAMLAYIRRDFEQRFKILKWFNPLLAFSLIMWAIGMAILGSLHTGMPLPNLYRLVALAIPLCVYMHPLAYVGIAVVTDFLMMGSLMYFGNDLVQRSAGSGTILPMLIVRVALVVSFYYLEFSVRERIITYEAQKKEISDLNNAQNRFFSSMSHEIRTPINTIIGLNEMILREKVSDEVAEDAANIRAASNMLLHVINDILDMSKIRSGQMKLTPVAYRPGDMLSEIVGMLWMRCQEKGLEFHVEISPDIPSELFGDEVRIKQVLMNILNNAIKYTKKGSITLTIECTGISDGKADIIYSVKDTGVGIKKESIPHLFTAFKRVDEEENRYIEGTGLGLSIVKELTDLMGGKVSVNSVYTQGSTFVVEIPQTVTDYSTIGNINFEEKHKANTSGSYRSSFEAPEANILAVDDNVSNLMVVKKLLRDTKVMIDTAENGVQALELTLEKTYDVIFMDHLMPEMDGIECLRKIRSQTGGASKSAKVIALTANGGSEMRKLYADEGFDGYLIKPVNAEELEAELMRLLPKSKVSVSHSQDNILENSMSWLDESKKRNLIAITSESVADIPKSLLSEYNIAIIPHKVETEDGIFCDGDEIDSDGLLDYMTDKHVARTHAPSAKEYEDFFAKAISKASNVIHINLSSYINNSGYSDAFEGAVAFNNVTVFDSHHLSSGLGLIVLMACRYVSEGLSVDEIINNLTYDRKRVQTSFIVDNLDHLANSGQVSTRLAAIGNAMLFHPVLDMKNGRLVTYRFYFGSRAYAWKRYINSTLGSVSDIDTEMLFVTYVGLTQKDLDFIRELVEKRVVFKQIYFQKASPTIAVNSGPGTFGLLFVRKI
ncbi:MAG: DegV family EDD domain-containing protein [Lachnospiraceae bacterium]|nr:DegV family EDD domain-containing protein [Lachnospiraceae bacterium]